LFDGSSPRREAGIQARVRLVFCLGPGLRRGDELTPSVPAIYSGQGDELVPSMLAIYPGQTGPAPLRRALIRRIVIPARGRDPGASACLRLGPGLRRGPDELTPAVPAIYSGQGDERVPSMLAIYPGQTGPAPTRRALIRRIVIPARGRDPGARPRVFCLGSGLRRGDELTPPCRRFSGQCGPAPGDELIPSVPAIYSGQTAPARRALIGKDRHPGARPGSRRASALSYVWAPAACAGETIHFLLRLCRRFIRRDWTCAG
jgi:hypothetical protein